MIKSDIFTDIEKLYLNSAQTGTPLSKFTKESVVKAITYARNVSNDADIIAMLEELSAKVTRLTDEEWNEIKKEIPFQTSFTESAADDIPTDEDEM